MHFPKALLTVFFVIISHLLSLQTSHAISLSKHDCPVKLGPKISEQMNQQECHRYTHPSRKNYSYQMDWKWNDYLSYGEAAYFPLKPGFYWETAKIIKKDELKDWHELRNVRASKVQDLECKGFTCYIFADPSGDGYCLFYQRDFDAGDKFSDKARASSLLYGYNCDTGKAAHFTTNEAVQFLSLIKAP